jgi:mRNA interferase RelE/StbE
MWKLEYTEKSKEDLKNINLLTQKRIIKKLDFFINSEKPLFFAEKLINSLYGEYRFRVWDYRILFDVDKQWQLIIIAIIWHRKEIYK